MAPTALLINLDDSRNFDFIGEVVDALTALGYTVKRDESGMFGTAIQTARTVQPDLIVIHASTCPWYDADSSRPPGSGGTFENWVRDHPEDGPLYNPETVAYLRSDPQMEASHIRPHRILPDIPALLAHLDYVIDELPV